MAGSFLPPVIMEIQANATQAIASMRTVNAELTKMEIAANAAGASLTRVEKASIIAGTALKAIGVATAVMGVLSVKAAMDQDSAFARMDEAIANAKDTTAATGEEFRKTTQAAIEMGFADQEAAGALGTLVTATGSASEAQYLLNSAMDLARYKHMSLNQAATIMARGTQGSAKAFKELGITLDTSIPKQQAINKAFDQLNAKIGGQSQAYLGTFAGKMSVLEAKVDNLAESFGNLLIPGLSIAIDFFSKYAKQIAITTGVIVGAIIVFKTYVTVMNLFKAAQILYIALTVSQAAAQTALTFATEGGVKVTKSMAAAQAILNAVMKANPYVLIATAVIAIITALVLLYQHNAKVHNAMIATAQGAIHAFSFLLLAIEKIVQAFVFLETGPLHLLLKAFAALGFGPAKSALDELNKGIKASGDFFDSARKKLDNYANGLDGLKKATTTAGMQTAGKTTNTGKSNLSSYTGTAGSGSAAGGGGTTIVQNVMVYASDTNDIAKKLAKSAKGGIPVGAK
ncbi:MAG: hypothetical protein EBS18_02825 [Actinobacteria bacterium]|nr:hypothetical protein [Actinomycetota bacterium]